MTGRIETKRVLAPHPELIGGRATSSNLGPAAPASHRLSVIIPARNEAETLPRLLELLKVSNVFEVIVVDGESSDETHRVAASLGARVVRSDPGRGLQLNAGARAARGDTFLFLHADMLPPPEFDASVQDVLVQHDVVAGAFRLRIDAPHRSFRIIEKLVDWRCRVRQLPFGDQGLFLRREMFDRVGGFPDIPVMEDYVFVRALRKLGRIALTETTVVTSARRWLQHGVVQTSLRNNLCLMGFHLGVSPARLARWRDRGNAAPIATGRGG